MSEEDKATWPRLHGWVHLLVLGVLALGVYVALAQGAEVVVGLYYLGIASGCFVLGSLGLLLLRGGWRELLALLWIVVITFVLPFGLWHMGCPLEVAAIAGVAYVIVVVASTPVYAGAAAFVGSIFCTVILVYLHGPAPGEFNESLVTRVMLGYAGLAVLAFAWRLLIHAISGYLENAVKARTDAGLQAQNDVLLGKMAELESENRALRENVAKCIVELRQLTARR